MSKCYRGSKLPNVLGAHNDLIEGRPTPHQWGWLRRSPVEEAWQTSSFRFEPISKSWLEKRKRAETAGLDSPSSSLLNPSVSLLS
jgi:hypothetical protein